MHGYESGKGCRFTIQGTCGRNCDGTKSNIERKNIMFEEHCSMYQISKIKIWVKLSNELTLQPFNSSNSECRACAHVHANCNRYAKIPRTNLFAVNKQKY